MRLSRMRFTIRSMMVGVVVLGIASWEFARYQRWSYYDMGWWEAEREIWRGELTIYTGAGLGRIGSACCVDRETGLPTFSDSGCCVQKGEDERREGHNDHVSQYIRWHGLPSNSLKLGKKSYSTWDVISTVQSRIVPPIRLCAGGTARRLT